MLETEQSACAVVDQIEPIDDIAAGVQELSAYGRHAFAKPIACARIIRSPLRAPACFWIGGGVEEVVRLIVDFETDCSIRVQQIHGVVLADVSTGPLGQCQKSVSNADIHKNPPGVRGWGR